MASQKIEWLLIMENKAPFTSNEDYLKEYRDKFLRSYRLARAAPILRRKDNHLVLEQIVARDPYDEALPYMASAQGYFQGSHRFLS